MRCRRLFTAVAILSAVGSSGYWAHTAPIAADSVLQAAGQTAACESAQESLNKALERAGSAGSEQAALREALGLIQLAVRRCPNMGDAFYYGALIYTQLGDSSNAAYYRQRAELFKSEALRDGRDLSGKGGAAVAISEPPMRIARFVRKRLALVVGIGQFKDPSINPLRFTARDATAVADALRTVAKFDYVKSLTNEEATGYNIRTEVNRLSKMAEPEDLVVVYFSSHGSPDTLDTAGINYIVTYDTEVNNLYATAYKMDDLLEDIGRRIKSERVVAFLDTCYSGGTFRTLPTGWRASSRALVADGAPQAAVLESRLKSGARIITVDSTPEGTPATVVNRVPQGVGRVVITSSSQNERSWEDERIEHGYFTYFLLEGLKQKSPVSVEDLYEYVKGRVSEAVTKDKNESQRPNIARDRARVEVYLRDEITPVPAGRR